LPVGVHLVAHRLGKSDRQRPSRTKTSESTNKARFFAGVSWKRKQIVIGRTYPTDRLFVVHETLMYKFLYVVAMQVKAYSGIWIGFL